RQVGSWETETCCVGGDPDVAGNRQLTASAERETVHGGGGWLLVGLDVVVEALQVGAQRGVHRVLPDLGDVRAGEERLLTGPGEDDDRDRVVVPELVQGRADVQLDLAV